MRIHLILKKNILSLLFLTTESRFDCLDGAIARICDKRTKFGSFYDSFSDFMKIVLIFIYLLYTFKNNKYQLVIIIFIFIQLLSGILYNNK